MKETSDVQDHPEFADRMFKEMYFERADDLYKNDWLINDFTLEEVQSLGGR